MENIKIIEHNNSTWINIANPGEKELGFLASNFDFHEHDLKDCLPPLQRPKLIERDDYLFAVLQFPVYDRKTKKTYASEVDFFILADKLITVHSDELQPIIKLFELCQTNEAMRAKLFCHTSSRLLYELLDKLLLYCFPMLNHISWDIDRVEKKIFGEFNRQTIGEILNIKRNIVYFRKSMQAHKNVYKKLIRDSETIYPRENLAPYFSELIEYTKEIWDLLENYKDSISALYETHESLTNFRLSNIMKTLTIFSVIVFPLTLLAAIFGMNTLGAMPFADHPYGFWFIVMVMAVGSVAMYMYFKRKKWI
ncbi:magnesium transporter CorA family protein [Patescibacteria group bacterium]|nr:magnesium transporter CorA family protein [Patescibacteria group bacterium]MBU4512552.1 magnesium transporter CorA family protein [Patescibacteria group bacterium]MCG2693062.1 magnesium transporter CorA family protein [Candidatus Parcubacteria bacterium]